MDATFNDGLGNGVDTVKPGDLVTYRFLIANEGKSAAEDVEIQDAMPHITSYVKGIGKFLKVIEKEGKLRAVCQFFGPIEFAGKFPASLPLPPGKRAH